MANVDWTKPIQTRDGRKARVICTDAKKSRSVIVLVENSSGGEHVHDYEDNGSHYSVNSEAHVLDVINVPEKRTWKGWINVYENGYIEGFPAKRRLSSEQCITCIERDISYTVGEGLGE